MEQTFNIDWKMLEALMQWLIIPGMVFIWTQERRLAGVEKELLRMLTITEERNKRRDEDREEMAEAMKSLKAEIISLAHKVDKIIDGERAGPGGRR